MKFLRHSFLSFPVFFPGLLVMVLLALGAGSSHAVTLQSVYHSAGPGDGYDKLVILERGEIYIGPLTIPGGVKCCIRGNAAVCSLLNSDILVMPGSVLDIFDTVLSGGHSALSYMEGSSGYVSGNTICGGYNGVRIILARVTIENNIIANNSGMGIAAEEELIPYIQYNDVWNNEGGDYMAYCSG